MNIDTCARTKVSFLGTCYAALKREKRKTSIPAKMAKKMLIGGNWKCNGTKASVIIFIKRLWLFRLQV